MAFHPNSDVTTWSCACRSLVTDQDLSKLFCQRCEQFMMPLLPDTPPVVLVNPTEKEPPATPPKNPPRAQQHGQIEGIDLRELSFRAELRGSELKVILALYDHRAPGSWIATISQEKLAEILGLNRRTVYRAIDALYEKGWIVSQRKRGKKGGGFFLEYRLRPFMPESGRTTERPKATMNTKRTSPTRLAEAPALPQRVLSQTGDPDGERCTVCQGTGWEIVEDRGARRCPSCRKTEGVTAPK
jgi:predicted transcriptional regulator